jgi:hypothetical protein
MDKKIFKWLTKALIGYVVMGSVYYLSGWLYNLSQGKEIVFSHIVGYPLTVIGWPMMLYADFIHRDSLGIKPSLVFSILTLVLVVLWILRLFIIELNASKGT